MIGDIYFTLTVIAAVVGAATCIQESAQMGNTRLGTLSHGLAGLIFAVALWPLFVVIWFFDETGQ